MDRERAMPSSCARVLVLCWLALALPARAEPEPSSQGDYATLVSDALQEFDAKNYVEARALFLRAHKLQPSARTLRGVGAVDFELRRYAECVTYLSAALAATEKPLTGALREDTEKLRQRALGYVAVLQVRLAPATATLILDGEGVAAAGEPLWLDIGEHTLAAEAEGYASVERSYAVGGGEHDTLVLTLMPLPSTVASSAVPHDAAVEQHEAAPSPLRRHRLRLGSALLAGAGIASFGFGAWRLVEHVNDGKDVRKSGPEALRTQRQWLDSRSAPLALAGVGAGLLSASSALAAPLVPKHTRRWSSPLMFGVGVGLVAAAVGLAASGERCASETGAALRPCVLPGERRDRGIFLSFVSIPFFTMPVLHTIDWLRGG
jgi:hypothetical protein